MLKTFTVLSAVLAAVYSQKVRDPYHDVQPQQPFYLAPTDKFFIRGGINPQENTIKYWHDVSSDIVRQRLQTIQRTGVAKNVILFLGDGMSIPTITAARIYLGQLNNEAGENSKLSFEKFPYTGLSKVDMVPMLDRKEINYLNETKKA
uniref:alkaline phosphatase n=2 Tax=Homalodisca liturata TaxID=320908 RepID=A0A1B6ITI3_9HEMI